MIVVYHNPRCRKSRECLGILETKKADYKVIKYFDEPLTEEKLGKIIKLIGIEPIDLIRKNEKLWKENFATLEFSAQELIQLMIKYPKLMERPIVVNGNKAVIGRPPTKILDII